MSELNFRIAATLDAGGFNGAAAAIRGVGTATTEVTGAMEEAATAVDLVKGAIGGFMALQVVQFLRDIVNDTVNAQQNEARLKLAVDNTGQSYDANKSKINGFLEATQALTGVGKEELVPVLASLVTKNGDVNKSLKELNLTIGVSRGMQMDLGSAANLVSGVINGQPRALQQAAKAMGLDSQSKKDNALVMDELTKRYGDFADKQPALAASIADVTNQWANMKVMLGSTLGPAIVYIGDILERVVVVGLGLVKKAIQDLSAAALNVGQVLTAPFALFSKTLQAVSDSFGKTATSLRADSKKTGADIWAALTFQGKPTAAELNANLLAPHQAAYLKLNEIEKKALADGDVAAAASGSARLAMQLKLLDQETEAQKTALRDQDNYSRLSAQNQDALMQSVDQQAYAKRLALQKTFDAQQAAEQKTLIDSQIAMAQKGSSDWLNLELKALEQEAAAQKQQAKDSIMTEQQRMDAIMAIDNNTTAKRHDLYQQYYSAEIQMSDQAANAIGTSLGQSLAGQQDAWKSALTQMITMIVNYAAKAITANYAVGASTQVAEGGWAGVASGAALVALGAIAVAAISSTSTDPTSSAVASTTVAGSAPSTSATSATQFNQTQAGINLVVQGDMINDTAYIDRLAMALSSAVNNRDVRLVSTSTTNPAVTVA